MHQQHDHRHEVIRRTFVYALMTIIVCLLATILLFVVQGYQYNRNDGQIEQVGMLQFTSKPSGATVTVNGQTLNSRTDTKYYGASGTYTVEYTRDGYIAWQKSLSLKAGSVVWLNYARFIPEKLTSTTVATFSAIQSSLRTPNSRSMVLLADQHIASLQLVNLTSDTPTITPLVIPTSAYTTEANSTFHLIEWDRSSRYILLRHDLTSKTEWLIVDTSDVSRTINLSNWLSAPQTDVHFAYDGGQTVYALGSDAVLRRLDAGNSNNTATIIASTVARFQNTHQSIIATVSQPSTVNGGAVTIGYSKSGDTSPTIVTTSTSPESRAAAAHYYDADYFVYSTTDSVIIRDLTHNTSVATLPIAGVKGLRFSPSGRFIAISTASNTTVYDLELSTTSTLSQASAVWLDDYYITSVIDGKLQLMEFDGTNRHAIGAATDQATLLTDDGRYLYYFTASGDHTALMRTQLIL